MTTFTASNDVALMENGSVLGPASRIFEAEIRSKISELWLQSCFKYEQNFSSYKKFRAYKPTLLIDTETGPGPRALAMQLYI